MQEVSWICNLWLLWQTHDGQYPSMNQPTLRAPWVPVHACPFARNTCPYPPLHVRVSKSNCRGRPWQEPFWNSCVHSSLLHCPGNASQPSSPWPPLQFLHKSDMTQLIIHDTFFNYFCKTLTLPNFTIALRGPMTAPVLQKKKMKQ